MNAAARRVRHGQRGQGLAEYVAILAAIALAAAIVVPRLANRAGCGLAQAGAALSGGGCEVLSWGFNLDGELGQGGADGGSHATPAILSSLGNVRSVYGGYRFGAALRQDGTVWAWGDNTYGELGDGTNQQRTSPVQVVGPGGNGYLSGITAIDVFDGSAVLALRGDGTVWSWGDGGSGRLGIGSTSNQSAPNQVLAGTCAACGTYLTGVIQVAEAGATSYALRSDGTVWAWGDDSGAGQLGDGGAAGSRTTPAQVLAGACAACGTYMSGVTSIAVGSFHALVTRTDGTVWGWGGQGVGEFGQSAPGGTTAVQLPVTGVAAVAAGWDFTLIAKSDGTVWATGNNAAGQLGTDTTCSFPCGMTSFAQVPTVSHVIAIAAESGCGMALASDGTVWMWGANGNGNDGTGSPSGVAGPGRVINLSKVVAIGGGEDASYAVSDQ